MCRRPSWLVWQPLAKTPPYPVPIPPKASTLNAQTPRAQTAYAQTPKAHPATSPIQSLIAAILSLAAIQPLVAVQPLVTALPPHRSTRRTRSGASVSATPAASAAPVPVDSRWRVAAGMATTRSWRRSRRRRSVWRQCAAATWMLTHPAAVAVAAGATDHAGGGTGPLSSAWATVLYHAAMQAACQFHAAA